MTLKTPITLRKGSNSYTLNLSVIGGKRIDFPTRQEAEDRWKAELQQYLAEFDNSKTFEEAAAGFLKQKSKTVSSKELTNIQNSIKLLSEISLFDRGKTLGEANMGALTRTDINNLVRPKLSETRKPKTVENILAHLKQVFSFAADQDWIKTNVMADLKLDRRTDLTTSVMDNFTQDKLRKILDAARHYKREIQFAAFTGLRASEQIALTWDNIDFDKRIIQVRTSSYGHLKTKAARRNVPLLSALKKDLEEWRLNQPDNQRLSNNGARNLVFPSRDGNFASVDNWRNRGLHKACDAAGVDRIRWHDLRHFFASMLIYNPRVDEQQLAIALGHTSADFTRRIYGHIIEDSKNYAAIANTFDAAFEGVTGGVR